jgi:hypothetical protein
VPLIRGHHSFDDHFTQIPNDWLRDNRLTFKARGILAMIMSHSQGWSLSINSIAATNQEGKDAIRSAIKELEDFGYLLRTQINEGGKFGEAVWVTQDPADLPMTDNPTTENPTTKNNNNKEEQVKNNTQELFDEFWTAYPRKLDKAKAFRAFKSALKRAKFEDILAGVIAYRNDPKRDPDFTKYPATWLNSDAWENAATLPEVRADIERRREKALADSQAFLKEQEELAKKAAPPSPELRKKLGL